MNQAALDFVLRWEGGFVNHPADPGGATNKGVTQATYDQYRRSLNLTPQSVRNITDPEVKDIYNRLYWMAAKCDRMVSPLALAHFDTAVNFGVGGAIRFLQSALGVTNDGIWGPITEAAFQRGNCSHTAMRIQQLRFDYRQQRVREQPGQVVFLKGWLNRDRALLAAIRSV